MVSSQVVVSKTAKSISPGLKLFVWVASLLASWPALSSELSAPFGHTLYDTLLTKYVEDGNVDYRGLAKDRGLLERYLAQMAAVEREKYEKWDEPSRLAFLINLYNAATLNLILDHYPVESIKKIGGFFTSPWELEVVGLWGKKVSLDFVEHEIIRKKFDEPRIHGALVCAARGCPPLRSEAYSGRRLDAQLDSQMRLFLSDRIKNRVDKSRRVAHLSPVFKWYGADFEKNDNTLLGSLAPYWPEEIQGLFVTGRDWIIRFTRYDWALNEMRNGGK